MWNCLAGGLLAAEVLAPPEVMKKRLATQVNALWGAVRQRSIFLPAVFVFLWQVRGHETDLVSLIYSRALAADPGFQPCQRPAVNFVSVADTCTWIADKLYNSIMPNVHACCVRTCRLHH